MICFDITIFFPKATERESLDPLCIVYYAQLYHFFSKFGRTYHSFAGKTRPSIREILLQKR